MHPQGNRLALLLLGAATGAKLWQPSDFAAEQSGLPASLLGPRGQACLSWAQAGSPEETAPGGQRSPPELCCTEGRASDVRPKGVWSPAARLTVGLPLFINCSDAAALLWLPFVQRRAAEALVAHRAVHGPYQSPADLRRVRFVGRRTAERLAEAVSFAWPCDGADQGVGWQGGEQRAASPGTSDEEVSSRATRGPAAEAAPRAPAARLPMAHGAVPVAWHLPAPWATAAGVQRPWLVHVLRFLPANGLSRLWGWLTRVRRPAFFASWLKHTFVTATGIDMAESAGSIDSYACLQDLFVRALKPGARPIDADPQVVVSPTDSRVGAHGIVELGTLYQIKGHTYRLAELLGDAERARQFEGGAYMTLYLSPRDYHRIHSPAGGHVTAAQLLPGRLLPVFPAALTQDAELLARNERIVTYLRSIDASEIAVVAVGATLVGRMRMAYDPSLRGNVAHAAPRKVRYAKPIWLERGEELGAFELGSTVVLLCQRDKVTFDDLPAGTFVRMGQRLGKASRAPRGRDQGGAPSVVYQPDEEL